MPAPRAAAQSRQSGTCRSPSAPRAPAPRPRAPDPPAPVPKRADANRPAHRAGLAHQPALPRPAARQRRIRPGAQRRGQPLHLIRARRIVGARQPQHRRHHHLPLHFARLGQTRRQTAGRPPVLGPPPRTSATCTASASCARARFPATSASRSAVIPSGPSATSALRAFTRVKRSFSLVGSSTQAMPRPRSQSRNSSRPASSKGRRKRSPVLPLGPHPRQARQAPADRARPISTSRPHRPGMAQARHPDPARQGPVPDQPHPRPPRRIHQVAGDRAMLPDPHLVRHAQVRQDAATASRLGRAFRPQPVIHRHRLDPQPGRQAQMQKGGGIPTARKRHADGLVRWKRRPDQPDQPLRLLAPEPLHRHRRLRRRHAAGKRVPTSASVTQASGTWPSAPNPSPSFNSASPANGPSGAAENASR
jgi:hypothetical protein